MAGTIGDIAARMDQRKQRLLEEQQQFERKQNIYAQNPDAISEPSEMDSSRQAPKPKRRHHRSANKSPFDDDSSLQFNYSDRRSTSTATTSSSTPRQANKFLKKAPVNSSIPVTTEKLSVSRSPRDVSSPRVSTKQYSSRKSSSQPATTGTGILAQSSLLARAAHRQQLFAKGIELEPGAFDQDDNEESSSDATSTSGARILAVKKSFVKKKETTLPENQVPELQHLDSETNNSEYEEKKTKHRKSRRPASVQDTDDDLSLDIIGGDSSSEGRKTPTLTPRKGILKSPKDFIQKDYEYSVQFSEKLVTVQDHERTSSPTKTPRTTTPRRVQIVQEPIFDHDDTVHSETESISTAIDVVDEEDEIVSSAEFVAESPVDNMFANVLMNDEPLFVSPSKKKSPRQVSPIGTTTTTTKKSQPAPVKYHHSQRTVSDISEDENTKIEEIPEEISTANYSEDFSVVPTESSTPRTSTQTTIRQEKQSQPIRKVQTDNQQVQVDLTSAPFQSSLNHVHSIYLINQTDGNETRPSSLIRSVVEPNVLQSLLTTNPVLLAVDDLIREQSSLLRSFIHLQRTYYESTVRSIRPDHIYVTKDNSLQYIADQQQSRNYFQSNDDSITN